MALGGAGAMTGVGGDRPYLNPAVMANGKSTTSFNTYLGARAIDRQHFIETFEDIEENFEKLQLEKKFKSARTSFKGGNLDSVVLRDLGTAADQVIDELNKLPDRYIRIAASAGAHAVSKQQNFAIGAFVRHYEVLSGVVRNDPRDLQRISQLSATAHALADTIDTSRQLDDLVHQVNWPVIEDMVRESLQSGAVDEQLVDYENIAGLQALLNAIEAFEQDVRELNPNADPRSIQQLARQIDLAGIEAAIDRSLDSWVLHDQLRNYEQIAGIAPLLEGLKNFERDIKQLDRHVNLQALAEFVVSENAVDTANELEINNVDLRNFLRYEIPEDINSVIIYSGAEVTETALNFSLMPPSIEGFAVGVNVKQQEYSTIAYSQRLDEFKIEEYKEDYTRMDYQFWNMDLGVSYTIARYWSFGAVIKNIFKKQLDTRLGGQVVIRPIARAGIAFGSDDVMLAFDVDLTRNEPLGFDGDKQYLSIGSQFRLWGHQIIRFGYRHNLVDQTGLPAVGLGAIFDHGSFDLAATYSDKYSEAGVALQMGLMF